MRLDASEAGRTKFKSDLNTNYQMFIIFERWLGKLNGHLMASCLRNISTKKLLKSHNSSSSCNRKCLGCFLRHIVYSGVLATGLDV